MILLLLACTDPVDPPLPGQPEPMVSASPEGVSIDLEIPAWSFATVELDASSDVTAALTTAGFEVVDQAPLSLVNAEEVPVQVEVMLFADDTVEVEMQLSTRSIDEPCDRCEDLVRMPFPVGEPTYLPINPRPYQFGQQRLTDAIAKASARTGALHVVADLSQADGEIPGTDVGFPRHPFPSHLDGFSADIGYHMLTTDPLLGGPACPSSDLQFCEGPHDLDLPQNVRFMAALVDELILTQVIVDPVMEADLRAEIAVQADALGDSAVRLNQVLTSGLPFHADHFHIAVARQCYNGLDDDGDGAIDFADPDCVDALDDDEGQ